MPNNWQSRAQKLISSSISQHLSTRNISSKSMHAFLSNLAHRQTDRQTDRQTNAGKTFTSSFVGGTKDWRQEKCKKFRNLDNGVNRWVVDRLVLKTCKLRHTNVLLWSSFDNVISSDLSSILVIYVVLVSIPPWCIFPPNLVQISSQNHEILTLPWISLALATAILDFNGKWIWHVPARP